MMGKASDHLPLLAQCKRKMASWYSTSLEPVLKAKHLSTFFLSTTMFKMFVGYYLLAMFDPFCVVNDGFHDLLDIITPEGSLRRPVRPAAVSCRTHFVGRTMDIIQALMGQRSPQYRAAAVFSDSPHFFYPGFKPNGEWYQLYQIGFGGVPARPIGDGVRVLCNFPFVQPLTLA
jgi:5-oxoprolinase (ATP-hydrolysing)